MNILYENIAKVITSYITDSILLLFSISFEKQYHNKMLQDLLVKNFVLSQKSDLKEEEREVLRMFTTLQ